MIIIRVIYAAIMHLLEITAPLLSNKLRQRQRLWRGTIQKAHIKISELQQPVIWFHAASAGEFEQAKPIIELLNKSNKKHTVIASFFSPSGYNSHRNYQHVDAVVYLPLDAYFSVQYFLHNIQPSAAVIIRYELWPELFRQIHQANIPLFLISATFPTRRILPLTLRSMLRSITAIFTANKESAERFRSFITPPTTLISSSDTRFDRIRAAVQDALNSSDAILPDNIFSPDDIVVVMGSSWPEDEQLIAGALESKQFINIRCIIVPHVVTPEHLRNISALFPDAATLSELNSKPNYRHIIVDSYGKLLQLYSKANIAYIGGGFGAGVHSAAEPAGYGVPILSGPNIKRSPDAIALHKSGALQIIRNVDELVRALSLLAFSQEARLEKGAIARHYIESGIGASSIIVERILAELENDKSIF